MDRRRPRRQSVGDHRRDRVGLARECAGRLAPLPRAGDRARAAVVDHRARHESAEELPRDARARARGERRGRRHRGAQSGRGLPPISHLHVAQARRHHRPDRGTGFRRGGDGLRQCRRADRRSPRARSGAGGGQSRRHRRRSRAAGAGRGANIPLLHGAARFAREHDPHHGGAAGAVVGEHRSRRGRAARAQHAGMAELAAPRTRPPTDGRAGDGQPAGRGGGDHRHVSPGGGAQARARPRGVRQLHPVDDALGGRCARRLSARQGGRRLSRYRRHGNLPAADRAAVRDHRRSARRARHHGASCSTFRSCAAAPIGRGACRR